MLAGDIQATSTSRFAGIADTHAALWYLHQNPRLSVRARAFMDDAARQGKEIGLSPISLAEIVYLVEKDRILPSAYEDLKSALSDPDCVIEEAPFTRDIVEAMRRVPRVEVPDMPDRIIAATAIYFGVPVISRDGRIRAANIHIVAQLPSLDKDLVKAISQMQGGRPSR